MRKQNEKRYRRYRKKKGRYLPMKRFFAVLMVACMLASMLCITASAEEAPAAGVVLRVSAIKKDGVSVEVIKDFTSFEEGWNEAISRGTPKSLKNNGYTRIVVDFYADWVANDQGEFGDDDGNGFDNTTIEIPDDIKITLNLNGHTINRNLKESRDDGEVIYIDEDANVIINNGTITGGKSTNGAGGIHIHDADVELNGVHIVGNVADNDDGGGIALYDGAQLVMSRGSFTGNSIDGVSNNELFDCYGGAIYIEDSQALFYNVEFRNNYNTTDEDYGAAIYVDNGFVYLSECTFDGNGVADESKNVYPAVSIVHANDSTLTMEKVSFTNNGSYCDDTNVRKQFTKSGFYSSVIALDDSTLEISDDSAFMNNGTCFAISCKSGAHVYVEDTIFANNKSFVMNSGSSSADDSYFKNCTFENNSSGVGGAVFMTNSCVMTVTNCTFTDNVAERSGGAIYNDSSTATLTVDGCTFTGNTGNGAITSAAPITLNNCTFGDDQTVIVPQ